MPAQNASDKYHREILTVKQLKELLAPYDDDVHVVMDDNDGWWINIKTVGLPSVPNGVDDPGDFQCITFIPGMIFDSRQF